MKRGFALFLLGLVALVAAFAALPARWLLRVVPDGGLIALVDADGSIWQGSARVALGPPVNRRSLPDAAAWRWTWQNGPAIAVSHPWLGGPLLLRPDGLGLALSGQSARLPATTLAALGAPFNTVQPDGALTLRWPAQRLGAPPRGELLTVQWDDAASALSRLRPLGSYRARFASDGRGIDLNLDTLRGVLQLQGSGRIERGAVRFAGAAEPAPQASDAQRESLAPLLSAMGRRSGERVALDIRSSP